MVDMEQNKDNIPSMQLRIFSLSLRICKPQDAMILCVTVKVFSSEWLIVCYSSSIWLLFAFYAWSLFFPVSPPIGSIIMNNLWRSFQVSTGCCLPKILNMHGCKNTSSFACPMTCLSAFTAHGHAFAVVSIPLTVQLFSRRAKKLAFNELCWSSLHRYTSLLGRQRNAGESIIILSFLSWRCESTSVKSPSIFVTFPLDLSPASLTLLLRPHPKKNWIRFKEVWNAWEEYNSSIAPVLLLTY